jgi:hypothetical protein
MICPTLSTFKGNILNILFPILLKPAIMGDLRISDLSRITGKEIPHNNLSILRKSVSVKRVLV